MNFYLKIGNASKGDITNTCCSFVKTLHYSNVNIEIKYTSIDKSDADNIDYFYKECKKIGMRFVHDKVKKTVTFNTSQVNNNSAKVFIIFTFLRFPFKYKAYFSKLINWVKSKKEIYPKINFFNLLYFAHMRLNINTSPNGLYFSFHGTPCSYITYERLKLLLKKDSKDLRYNNRFGFANAFAAGMSFINARTTDRGDNYNNELIKVNRLMETYRANCINKSSVTDDEYIKFHIKQMKIINEYFKPVDLILKNG